jgi:Zn-finger nucleic acid-binding protein
MAVETCSNCGGMWFAFKELDQLEDDVLLNDDMKGTLVWQKKPSERKCPKCGEKMTQFNYRLDDLLLEYCAVHMHGYWLDKGEAERVLEQMKERVTGLEKKYDAEEAWTNHLKRLQSPSFFSTLKDLL